MAYTIRQLEAIREHAQAEKDKWRASIAATTDTWEREYRRGIAEHHSAVFHAAAGVEDELNGVIEGDEYHRELDSLIDWGHVSVYARIVERLEKVA